MSEIKRTLSKAFSHPIGLRIIKVAQLVREVFQLVAHANHGTLPGFLKRRLIKREILAFRPELFVETGTYIGQTAYCASRLVKHVITIEISEALAADAQRRLRDRPNVCVLVGDSAHVLPAVIKRFPATARAMFWLDGHYSGGITEGGKTDCSVLAELEAISKAFTGDLLILIDDARCFQGKDGYPTLSDVTRRCEHLFPAKRVAIEDDIVYVRSLED